MGPLKNFALISNNLNKLQSNIDTVGFEESILKVGQDVPKVSQHKTGRKKITKGGGMSSDDEFDQYRSGDDMINDGAHSSEGGMRGRQRRDHDKKMRSSHKDQDLMNMASKPFFSPR